MFCKNCGKELKEGAMFCPGCGTQYAQKKKEKPPIFRVITNVLTGIICVFAIGIAAFSGYRVYTFVSEYGDVFAVSVTEEEVLSLEQEKVVLAEELSAKESELQRMAQREEKLSGVTAVDYEQKVRDCYIAKKEAESAARSFVLAKLEGAYYVTLQGDTPQSMGEMIGNDLIDELTGNAIVSAGVKSAIAAASEEMSLDSIINGAIDGAVAEVPDYINGEITGAIADTIGVDVFGVAGWISDFMNADDTPVALANSMVTEQRRDVNCILSMLEQEELTAADMQYMAGLMQRIRDRGEELVAAGSSAGGDFSGAEELEELARIWEENNYRILQYAEWGNMTDEN